MADRWEVRTRALDAAARLVAANSRSSDDLQLLASITLDIAERFAKFATTGATGNTK